MSSSIIFDGKTENMGNLESHTGVNENRQKLERKLVRTLDLRMTMLMVMFSLNYIDRTNVGAARLRGFEADLRLDSHKAQFETVLGIFSVGYTLMMVPSNMLLHRLGKPSLYLPGCSIVWAIISISTGFSRNFEGVVLCRFFLGFVEAAFLPGALFTLSSWYTQKELGLRTCLLWVGLIISIAIGQLVASGVLDRMENIGGYHAWRWLFFIDGAITFVVTIPAFFILPDFPNSPSSEKWLSPELLQIARERKREEVEDLTKIPDVSQIEGFMLAVKDWKVWWLALCVATYQLTQGYYQYFPTIIKTLGYNNTITLVLAVPPGFFSAVITFLFSRHSDHVQMRFPHIAAALCISAIGCVMAMSTMNVAVRYISVFFMQVIPAGFIILMAWVSNVITTPPAKKAVALGLVVAFSELGSLASSYVFPLRWGPRYINSFGISIAAAGTAILLCFTLRLHLASQNKKANVAVKPNPELRSYKYQL